MTKIRVGCAGHVGPIEKYWQAFDLMELGPEAYGMRSGTVRKWREGKPEHCVFVPTAHADLAEAKFAGDEAKAAWDATLELVERFGADTLLLHTPPGFRPSTANMDAMRRFFAERLPADLAVAWRAEGLWEGMPEELETLATELGFIVAFDPLVRDEDDPLPDGERAYYRVLGGRGLKARMGAYDLEVLLETCAERAHADVVFTAPTMRSDARQFLSLARGLLADDPD